MNRTAAVVWWPPIGLLAMVALGLAVGRGRTRVDDWFTRLGHTHRNLSRLLVFTDWRVVLGALIVCLVVAVHRRRWRLVAAVALTPAVAVVVARLLKRLFGRENDGALAYPSGHTTLMVVVLGLAVLLAGGATWSVVVATIVGLLGALGQAVTYHYFTDAVGAVLLGTALLCLAALAAKLDRCQPRVRRASQ